MTWPGANSSRRWALCWRLGQSEAPVRLKAGIWKSRSVLCVRTGFHLSAAAERKCRQEDWQFLFGSTRPELPLRLSDLQGSKVKCCIYSTAALHLRNLVHLTDRSLQNSSCSQDWCWVQFCAGSGKIRLVYVKSRCCRGSVRSWSYHKLHHRMLLRLFVSLLLLFR